MKKNPQHKTTIQIRSNNVKNRRRRLSTRSFTNSESDDSFYKLSIPKNAKIKNSGIAKIDSKKIKDQIRRESLNKAIKRDKGKTNFDLKNEKIFVSHKLSRHHQKSTNNQLPASNSSLSSKIMHFLELLFFGFKFHLLEKNLKCLFVKHLFYLVESPFFNSEFLLIVVCGLLRSAYLFVSLLFDFRTVLRSSHETMARNHGNIVKVKNKHLNLNVVVVGSELMLLGALGIVQLLNCMHLWDFKRRIQADSLFWFELFEYFYEILFTGACFVFYFFKCKFE